MKRILIIGGLLAIIGIAIGYSIYNKPHEDIRSAKAEVNITAPELFAAYEADETAANGKFLGKTVQVSGKVQEVTTDEAGKTGVTLECGGMMFGVICKLDDLTEHSRMDFEVGEEVVFKGKCSGYLSDVVLDRCVEVQK